ncbi:hypothetical protein CR513_10805, partial [Mucuna pruriens]
MRREQESYRERRYVEEPRNRYEEEHHRERELRSRFVQASYARDLYNRVQCMYQQSKSVEDYHMDMEVALIRANVLESNETTMAHFLHELNIDILDIVKLYHYASLNDLVHHGIKVEAQ